MRNKIARLAVLSLFLPVISLQAADQKPVPDKRTPLDRYIEESLHGTAGPRQSSPGTLWSPASRLTELGSDLRASQVNDLITIVVLEKASAVAQGTTKTQRQSAVNASVGAI